MFGVKGLCFLTSFLNNLSFPSPCGVFGVKAGKAFAYGTASIEVFPSPCGVFGVKANCNENVANSIAIMFPSPCGVFGVKVQSNPCPQGTAELIQVSVPLRGVWGESWA